jgi:hypothetical protein
LEPLAFVTEYLDIGDLSKCQVRRREFHKFFRNLRSRLNGSAPGIRCSKTRWDLVASTDHRGSHVSSSRAQALGLGSSGLNRRPKISPAHIDPVVGCTDTLHSTPQLNSSSLRKSTELKNMSIHIEKTMTSTLKR